MYGIIPLILGMLLVNEYRSSQRSKYVALGDSLAVGAGAFWIFGYARLFYNWLIQFTGLNCLNYCNLGVSGWTSENLLNAVMLNEDYRASIRDAAIITISVGGNDILNCKYSPEKLYEALALYRNNLFSILNEIRCLNGHAKVYLTNFYNPYPCGYAEHDVAEVWVNHFNDILWNVLMISEYKISGIANIYSAFKGNELNYTLIKFNNIHPNLSGHQVIKDCLCTGYRG